MHDEQKRIELKRVGHSNKVQNLQTAKCVFVHDLNQFVTVQLLEETTAVLSLGKLCKDHGYSYE